MATRHPDRWRRVATVVAAAALFVVPFLAAGPGSATIVQPVSVVTTVNGVQGGPATAGQVTTVSLEVTNKATNGAKLGFFTLVLPGGATAPSNLGIQPSNWHIGALGCGSTPRCGALLYANATRAAAFLPSGASATMTFQIILSNPGTLSLPLIGIGGGLFFATSVPTITVVPATSLKITSVTESQVPPLPIGGSGNLTVAFKIEFEVVDAAGNVVTSPNVTVSLSALNLGPLALLTTSPVTSSDGTGTLTATYVGPVITGLNLRLAPTSTPGPAPADTSVDLTAAGLTVNASPGEGLTITIGDVNLSFGAATAILSNGANGQVSFSIGSCVPDSSNRDCTVNGKPAVTEISLSADLKGRYSDENPARLQWQCNNPITCAPVSLEEGETLSQLQQAEFATHPVSVAPSNGDGTFGQATLAPSCSATDGSFSFCVDVDHISRSGAICDETCSEWDGILTIPVLFVNDPRFYSS